MISQATNIQPVLYKQCIKQQIDASANLILKYIEWYFLSFIIGNTKMTRTMRKAWSLYIVLVTIAVVVFQLRYFKQNEKTSTSSAIIRHGKLFML